MGRDGTDAFSRLTKRHAEKDADGDAIDLEKLNRAIRAAFVEIFIVQGKPWTEQKWIDRMLSRAIRQVKSTHQTRTHYLPCVALSKGHPDEFAIGRVRFISKEKFFADYRDKIAEDHEASRKASRARLDEGIAEGKYRAEDKKSEQESKDLEQKILQLIIDYYDAFPWVAEVTVPACSSSISRMRAETTVQAALDVLKLFFGPRGGKDFRLGHHRGQRARTAHLTRDAAGVFHHSIWSGGEGAFAEEGWYEDLKKHLWWALEAAGSAIEAYLEPRKVKSEHRDRWLGALHWYGQAVSERQPAAQLVKYVAALERLTVLQETGRQDVTDVVTRRTALLASECCQVTEVEKVRAQARKLYSQRSNLMHGRSSPLTKELLGVMHLAHRITRRAMFEALGLYVQLDMAGKVKGRDLEDRFIELESIFRVPGGSALNEGTEAFRPPGDDTSNNE
jgi:hypothetical protein